MDKPRIARIERIEIREIRGSSFFLLAAS